MLTSLQAISLNRAKSLNITINTPVIIQKFYFGHKIILLNKLLDGLRRIIVQKFRYIHTIGGRIIGGEIFLKKTKNRRNKQKIAFQTEAFFWGL